MRGALQDLRLRQPAEHHHGQALHLHGQVRLPKSKTKDRDTALLTLQLPNGFSIVSGKSSLATSAQPVTDANNLVTWTIPCADSAITLSLKIKASICKASPDLVGNFCYGNACQQLKLSKAPSMKC